MTYDLEHAVRRSIERLRGLASSWTAEAEGGWTPENYYASQQRRAAILEEIASSLAGPLQEIEQARERRRPAKASSE